METKEKGNKDLAQVSLNTLKAAENGEADEDIDEVPLFRKKRVIIPLLLILTAAAIGGYYWYINMQDFVSTDDSYIDANSVAISTKMLGRIAYLGTDEGDTVKTGQVLVRLDDRDLRAEDASAKAGLELAQESVPLAQVNVSRAQEDFNRAEVQYKGGIVTKEQYDHAQKALEAARAEYNIALSKISAARSQIGVIESQLQNTVISAPMDGVVAKRWVLTGDVVQPGQPVFTIYDLKNIWVTANLEETKLGHIHLNDPVQISVDSYPGVNFFGRVFEIGTYTASEFSLIPPNNASGNFTKVTQRVPIKISIDDPTMSGGQKPFLRPGMSVEVSVKVK
ncbi:MAG: HlyD family secretion protein [Bacteroidetes bacterium]|nr:HlyD family secretion protein [Bacteroidota bacterium]MCL5737051.1 HlyD family secretion protein [Bacteroidota bacterium]